MSEEIKKLKVGDVVKLKSGGPWMTVSDVYSEGVSVKVIWFPTLNADQPAEKIILSGVLMTND